MKIAKAVDELNPAMSLRTAGIVLATCILAAAPVFAQSSPAADERSGVSHPDSAPITIAPDAPSSPAQSFAKPSAAIPATPPTQSSETVYGPYVPYDPNGASQPNATAEAANASAFDPDAGIVTAATAGEAERRLLTGPQDSASKNDPDAGIVTHVPFTPGEIPDGTLVKVRLREEISTLTTQPGTKFTAEVSEPVMQEGRVIVPVGSMMEGRVTWVRGGKRIGGRAAIHLEPRTITLPDGSLYVLRARAIDTNSWDNTKVDNEGTIMRSENTKRNVAVMAMTTGSGMAAGALIGGLPGAAIGAGVGAGVSTVIWLKQDRQAVLPKDLGLVFSLTEPMSITPARAAIAPMTSGTPGGE